MAATSSPTASSAPARSLAPDLARGLMLAFIALANVSWFLWGQPARGQSAHPPTDGAFDNVLQFLMIVMIDGRTYPLFALLFGYGMVQFYRSRLDRGMEPGTVRRMLRRRHWAMLLLGALHAALLFMGDVLGAYGIAGLLLVWIFFGRRDRTLKIWLIVVVSLLTLGSLLSIVGGIFASMAPPDAIEIMNEQATAFSAAEVRDAANGQSDYLASVTGRFSAWAVLTVFQVVQLTIPLAIVIGWLAARHRVLDEPWNHRRLLVRTAVIGIAIGWIGGLFPAMNHVGILDLPVGVFWMFTGSTAVSGLACGVGYAALFGLIAVRIEGRRATAGGTPSPTADGESHAPSEHSPTHRADGASAIVAELPEDSPARRAYGAPTGPAPTAGTRPPLLVGGIAAVGARSLTFYLWQSLLMAPLLAAWGLGLGQHLSTAGALGTALAVWVLSVPLAMALDSRGRRGPAEVLLRRLTYGKHDPAPQQAR